MKEQLRELLPEVLAETGYSSEASLNAKIGGKAGSFINLLDEVIVSPDGYLEAYLRGLYASRSVGMYRNAVDDLIEKIESSRKVKEYFVIFVKRAYLKHFEELSKNRPVVEQAEIWIGENNAEYGLFASPRYANGRWENDKSEIWHLAVPYWTIGHVLETGLVVPDDPEPIYFATVDDYLEFFTKVLVRKTGSPHQKKIAKMYADYVRSSESPLKVPLLLPEFRYEGRDKKHKYRLDFTVFDPYSDKKVGFELSPWSSHGYIAKTTKMTAAEINKIASDNFEKEMKKHKDYFDKHGVSVLIFTDSDLSDPDGVFAIIEKQLSPIDRVTKMDFSVMKKFMSVK